MLNRDFREFIQSLNDNHVRYLVIGAYAVALHGYPRYTKDMDVWIEMSRGATQSLAVESFYYSDDPQDDDDPLDRVLHEVAAAADRGVEVRLLGDKGFYRTYPGILDSLGARPGVESGSTRSDSRK